MNRPARIIALAVLIFLVSLGGSFWSASAQSQCVGRRGMGSNAYCLQGASCGTIKGTSVYFCITEVCSVDGNCAVGFMMPAAGGCFLGGCNNFLQGNCVACDD